MANPVVWSAPTNITGDSNVSTLGTLVAAFDMNGAGTIVNGVTFAPFTFTFMATTATKGNFSFTESPGHLIAQSSLGSASPPFSSLSANYRELLSSAISTDDNNTLTLTMSGLVNGQVYQFQWWLNASSDTGVGPGFRTTASSGNSVTLDDNTTNAQGGVGQFATGTFTALGSVLLITLSEPMRRSRARSTLSNCAQSRSRQRSDSSRSERGCWRPGKDCVGALVS